MGERRAGEYLLVVGLCIDGPPHRLNYCYSWRSDTLFHSVFLLKFQPLHTTLHVTQLQYPGSVLYVSILLSFIHNSLSKTNKNHSKYVTLQHLSPTSCKRYNFMQNLDCFHVFSNAYGLCKDDNEKKFDCTKLQAAFKSLNTRTVAVA